MVEEGGNNASPEVSLFWRRARRPVQKWEQFLFGEQRGGGEEENEKMARVEVMKRGRGNCSRLRKELLELSQGLRA